MSKSTERSGCVRSCSFDIRCSVARMRCFCVVLLAVVLIALAMPPVAAQPLREPPVFRGLRAGNEITVLMASSRRTAIAVDGQPEVTTETSESIRIQYRVVSLERAGNLVVKVFIHKLDHQPQTPILSRLKVSPILLNIQPDGTVSTLNSESPDTLVMNLSNGDPQSAQVLKMCLTDESISSWFSVPFWMLRPEEDEENKDVWERSHDVSLGTLGSLQLDLSFRSGDIENSIAKVAISGEARFRPLVLPDADAAAFPFLSQARVEIDELSGTGQIHVASPDGDEPTEQRPEFESVEWTIRLHGEAELPPTKPVKTAASQNSDNDAATGLVVPGKTSKVTFRQTQHHVWKLQSFSPRLTGVFYDDRMTRPVPAE